MDFPPPEASQTLVRPPKPKAVRFSRRQTVRLLSVGAILVVLITLALFRYLFLLTNRTPVTLIVAGQPQTHNTRADTVGELLQDLNLTVQEGDALSVSPEVILQEGQVIRLDRARPVSLTLDGETQIHHMVLTNPAEILNRLGVSVAARDRVTLDGTRADPQQLAQWPVPVNQIVVQRARYITINDNGIERVVPITGETVGEALYEAGVTLYMADAVTPDSNTPLSDNLLISIARSVPATLIADGITLETRTHGATVGELLADVGVALVGLDYAIPAESTPVQPGMQVRVIRVSEVITSETELLPFGNLSQPDGTLELDQTRLVQAGQAGIQRTDTRIRYENDVEITRITENTQVVREAEPQIIAYGTGVALRAIDTPDGTVEYWRKIRMLTTSYHPAALGGDNVTATGRILTKGIVGVDPTVIPYGTQVYVPGYGIGIAADTGGPRSTRLWIDLGYDDENWVTWSQYSDVYILAPVPANIQYILPD